jgi:hypothetical protein
LVNLLAGAFLVTSTFGFDSSTAVNIGFGLSIAVCLLGLAMGYFGFERTSKNDAERISLGVLGILTAALAGWTVIATQVFDASTAKWMVFGSGLGHIVLAVAGIITQEATAPAARPAARKR